MKTLKITKQQWLADYSTQSINGHTFLAHPITIYKNENGCPIFVYKYFDDFGHPNQAPMVLAQIEIIVSDWIDFDLDTFKKELKQDQDKRKALFINK